MLNKIAGVLIGILIFLGTLLGLFKIYGPLPEGAQRRDSVKSVANGIISYKVVIGEKTFESSYAPAGVRIPEPRSFNLVANGKLTVTRKKKDKLIYHRTYHLNAFSMRHLQHVQESSDPRHLILAGCSFTFGEGLENEDSLPFKLEESSPGFNAYNFGFMGGSVNSQLHLFDVMDVGNYVQEKEGYFLYIFIQNHMNRFLARPDYLQWVPKWAPFYKFENGQIVYKGLIGDQSFYQEFKNIENLGLLEPYLRGHSLIMRKDNFTEADYSQFAKALGELRNRYLEKFPKGQFVFLKHPLHGIPQEEWPVLKTALLSYQIEVWEPEVAFAAHLQKTRTQKLIFSIPGDGHPNGNLNNFLADFIRSKLSY